MQRALFAQAAPCPKTAEIKSDFSREPRHVRRGFAVGFLLISLHPRNITSFLQSLTSAYFPGLGKGEGAYCASGDVICKACGVLGPRGGCGSLRLCSHGLCQPVVQSQAAVPLKPPPDQGLGHLCWAAACPVPAIRAGGCWCEILVSGCRIFCWITWLACFAINFGLFSSLRAGALSFAVLSTPSLPPVNGKKYF